MSEPLPPARVILVAVLVTPGTRPEDLSNFLDAAFEEWDDVVEFTVEGVDRLSRHLRGAADAGSDQAREGRPSG